MVQPRQRGRAFFSIGRCFGPNNLTVTNQGWALLLRIRGHKVLQTSSQGVKDQDYKTNSDKPIKLGKLANLWHT
jgi:hypothetical protein